MSKPLVQNAGDAGQVREAEKKQKIARDLELQDLRQVLALDAGRRFIWRLLEFGRAFGSVWEQSAKIHYNAGQQDFAHFIMGEVGEAKPEAILEMMLEAKKRKEQE